MRHGNISPVTAAGGRCDGTGFDFTVTGGRAAKVGPVVQTMTSVAAGAMTKSLG